MAKATPGWAKKIFTKKEDISLFNGGKKERKFKKKSEKEIKAKFLKYKELINQLSAAEQFKLIKEQPYMAKYISEPSLEIQRHIFGIDPFGLEYINKIDSDIENEFVNIFEEYFKIDKDTVFSILAINLSLEAKKKIINIICINGGHENYEDYFIHINYVIFSGGNGTAKANAASHGELTNYGKKMWEMCDIVEK